MRSDNKVSWDWLEEHSSTAFIVVAGQWFTDTVLLVFERFFGISIMGTPGPVNGVLTVFAVLVSIIGSLGLYLRLAEQIPRLAFASVAVSALTAIGFSLILVGRYPPVGFQGYRLSRTLFSCYSSSSYC